MRKGRDTRDVDGAASLNKPQSRTHCNNAFTCTAPTTFSRRRNHLQAELRAAFFDGSDHGVTQQLSEAMAELDLDRDGCVSLNEFVCFGLASSRSMRERDRDRGSSGAAQGDMGDSAAAAGEQNSSLVSEAMGQYVDGLPPP